MKLHKDLRKGCIFAFETNHIHLSNENYHLTDYSIWHIGRTSFGYLGRG